MKLKLDENLDARLAQVLQQAGHDTATVASEGLRGLGDQELMDVCIAEGRILVSLDMDFANVLRYPPAQTPGLVVLRSPNQRFATMRLLVETLAEALVRESPAERLWIVEPGRLRVHEDA